MSELNQSVDTSQIGEKIMNTSVQLSIHEILAVSGEVSNYLHEQTRKKRVPIYSVSSAVPSTSSISNSVTGNVAAVTNLNAQSKAFKFLCFAFQSR